MTQPLQTECIERVRDIYNKICGYRLRKPDGSWIYLSTKDLKTAIKANTIAVSNLRLTANNRLLADKTLY